MPLSGIMAYWQIVCQVHPPTELQTYRGEHERVPIGGITGVGMGRMVGAGIGAIAGGRGGAISSVESQRGT